MVFGEIIKWVSKVIRDSIGFAFPSPMIGRENSRHPLNQSETKRQVIETCSSIFPQALGS